MGLGLGIGAPGSIKRPRQSQARWAVGLQTGVSLLESLELSDVVSVVSSYHNGSSHLGLDNSFALFWFLNRDFYLVQMENPRGWILEFILQTPTNWSELKTSSKSRTRRSRRRRMWDHDLFSVWVILSPEAPYWLQYRNSIYYDFYRLYLCWFQSFLLIKYMIQTLFWLSLLNFAWGLLMNKAANVLRTCHRTSWLLCSKS